MKEERRKEDWVEELKTLVELLEALSQVHGMTSVTSVHNYFENYSFDSMNLCWQSDVSAF